MSLETAIPPRVAAPPRDVCCLQALSALGCFVVHLIALLEGLVCFAGGNVRATHEEVSASLIRTGKTIAALVAEPFDRSPGDGLEPSTLPSGSIATKTRPVYRATLQQPQNPPFITFLVILHTGDLDPYLPPNRREVTFREVGARGSADISTGFLPTRTRTKRPAAP